MCRPMGQFLLGPAPRGHVLQGDDDVIGGRVARARGRQQHPEFALFAAEHPQLPRGPGIDEQFHRKAQQMRILGVHQFDQGCPLQGFRCRPQQLAQRAIHQLQLIDEAVPDPHHGHRNRRVRKSRGR